MDISIVKPGDIPEHDLLVGGFPCQDYSVASTLKNSKGIEGKKGVLWWEIFRLLEGFEKRPHHILLENVDRLLSSPSKQKGRDFAIILSSLSSLGYSVEWMVIDPSLYGMPQRRKRVFIMAHHNESTLYGSNVIEQAFPCEKEYHNTGHITDNILTTSETFNRDNKKSPFSHYGTMCDNHYHTYRIISTPEHPIRTLGSIIIDDSEVPEDYFITEEEKVKWAYLKGAKEVTRYTKEGFEYKYKEGGMTFPDRLDRPSRTIITGEGGKAPSRFKHVIETDRGLRRLTPLELERLSMFPDGHTSGVPENKRAFLVGNALVVGVVEKIGKKLVELKIDKDQH
jgi:DNA (cytosine-5)-methyltransferase 1